MTERERERESSETTMKPRKLPDTACTCSDSIVAFPGLRWYHEDVVMNRHGWRPGKIAEEPLAGLCYKRTVRQSYRRMHRTWLN
jgi:hypothetical protein